MKRIAILLLLFAALVTLPAAAADASVSYNGAALDIPASLESGVTYVPLRAFCDAIGGCEVQWNASIRQAAVTGAMTLTVTAGSRTAQCGGSAVALSVPCYIRDGALWIPIRAAATALGCEVQWNQSSKTAALDAAGYSWLARIIEAEAGGEPWSGKVAVGNVVLNRVVSAEFPDNIKDVIFDTAYGYQFTPVSNGTIWCTPSSESCAAARACLAGENTAGGSLYFFNPATATAQSWIVQNRPFYASIGKHNFYV